MHPKVLKVRLEASTMEHRNDRMAAWGKGRNISVLIGKNRVQKVVQIELKIVQKRRKYVALKHQNIDSTSDLPPF